MHVNRFKTQCTSGRVPSSFSILIPTHEVVIGRRRAGAEVCIAVGCVKEGHTEVPRHPRLLVHRALALEQGRHPERARRARGHVPSEAGAQQMQARRGYAQTLHASTCRFLEGFVVLKALNERAVDARVVAREGPEVAPAAVQATVAAVARPHLPAKNGTCLTLNRPDDTNTVLTATVRCFGVVKVS